MSDSASLASNNIPVRVNTVEWVCSDMPVSQETSTLFSPISENQALVPTAVPAPTNNQSAAAGAPLLGSASSNQSVAASAAASAALAAASAASAAKCKTCGNEHKQEKCWGKCAVCNEVHPPPWQTVPVCSKCTKHHPTDEACPARNVKQCFMCASSEHLSSACQLKLTQVEQMHAAASAKAAENALKATAVLEKAQKAAEAAAVAKAIAVEKLKAAAAFAEQQKLMGTTFAATRTANEAAAAARAEAKTTNQQAKQVRADGNKEFRSRSGICDKCESFCKDAAECETKKAAKAAKLEAKLAAKLEAKLAAKQSGKQSGKPSDAAGL